MYLKSLYIKGFKTFADQTNISFHSGINIVVGPNGCGKSNLIDAIRWALGEGNIRHLRGNKSEDIIFCGTDNKRALSMASVELVIDNSDYSLPIESSELSISRKTFRTGESEFQLNKSAVRLKDIVALLSGTGIGKKGFSIIGQGELEQVLSGQPLERRMILEEASGVIKYRQQRDEVAGRILNTANHLLRIGDLLIEIGNRQDELKFKAEKAEQFLQTRNELKEIEKSVFLGEFFQLDQGLTNLRKEALDRQSAIKELTKDIDLKSEKIQESESELAQLAQAIRDKQHNVSTIDKEAAALESEIMLLQERIKNNNERLQQAKVDHDKYQSLIEDFDNDINFKTDDCTNEKILLDNKVKEHERLQKHVNESELFLQSIVNEFEESKNHLFKAVQKETALHNELHTCEKYLQSLSDKEEKLKYNLQENQNYIDYEHESINEKQAERQEILAKAEVLINDLNRIEAEHLENDALRQQIVNEVRLLNEELIKLNNRLQNLVYQEKEMSGYSNGVKQIINAAASRELFGILGIVGELIKIPSGLEIAIDTAIGRSYENIIVDCEQSAQEAITWLKVKKSGRLTFLPLDLMRNQLIPKSVSDQVRQMPGYIGFGSEMVTYDERYAEAFYYLLGRVLIIDNMSNAFQIFRRIKYPWRLVTLDGEIINNSGAISGGVKNERYQSPLLRKGEQSRLEKEIIELAAKLEDRQNRHKELEETINELAKKIKEIKNTHLEQSYKAEIIGKEIARLQTELNRKRDEIALFGKELTLINSEKKEWSQQIQNILQTSQLLHNENQILTEKLETEKEKIEINKRDLLLSKERINSSQEQIKMKRKELQVMENNLEQFLQIKSSYKRSLSEASALKNKLENELECDYTQIDTRKNKAVDKLKEAEVLKIELESQLALENSLRDIITKEHNELLPLKNKLIIIEEELRRKEYNLYSKETDLRALESKWWEMFSEAPPIDRKMGSSLGPLSKLKEERENFREKLERIGPVDVESIDEYQKIRERYSFLESQYKDLDEARTSLQDLLQETEKLMDKEYREFFELANNSFRQTCAEIFGGAEGSLRHESEKPLLEAGLYLDLKLPGKRTQTLNLLSGGEKALTCIAFIFSLMRLKPVPFCILDEIDAALDESNLRRFTGFIEKLAHEIQFIIITHRQASIEAGHYIYGVTMPEKGISSILSLRLPEDEGLAV